MLENSFGLIFFLKQPKNQKTKSRYIYLRITVDGVSKEFSTKRQWDIDRWQQSSGRAIGTKEDAKTLNVYLETLCSKIYQAKIILLELNKPVTAENLKNQITGNGGERKFILEIFKHHNEQMEALIGKEFARGTFTRYKTACDHVKSFIKWKYNLEDLELGELNFEFVSEYTFWLKSVRQCGHNSTVKYVSNLKKIVLQCVRKGWIKGDPFIDFKTARKEVQRIALTQIELDKIRGKEFSCERLSQVRDIFLFSCYTGLAYIDVSKLKRSQIIEGIDGEQWIITHRQKTETPTRLPLLPVAFEIKEHYKHHPKCANLDLVLPTLSNQKMNAYLKEIADVCGVAQNLTFHIARHTFATTITLGNGVPIETVSKMLGHKSLKQTQHYAKILDLKVSMDMKALKDKLSIVV